ncbi:MAG: glycosyltransferase family 4 protein [Desulfuromonas sp.]|nr:glycosyltransferase family 4 protein [Desulfuromonas sp.]
MRILIGSPERDHATGNWVTASRFRHSLEKWGHRVSQCYLPPQCTALDEAVAAHQPDLLLLLHAYRTGRPWLEGGQCDNLPTVMFLSGTDVNEGLFDAEQAPVIEQVMSRAGALLAHNPLLVAQVAERYPHLAGKLYPLPPAVELGRIPYDLRQLHHIAEHALLFLCPAGIRPVKGVLSLIELFDQLPAQPEHWQLAFCGPVLDADYARQFFAAVEQRPWVHYLGTIAPDAMAAALQQADVVMNNSTSEGLSHALLETSSLGRPILARDIPGNRPIVDHDVNGLLYHDQASFIDSATRLIEDSALRRRLAQPRAERYYPDREGAMLHRLCEQVLAKWQSHTR